MSLQKKTFQHGSPAGTRRFLTYSLVVPVLAASVLLSGCVSFQERSSASEPLSTVLESTKDSRQTKTPAPLSFPASAAIVFIPGKYAHIPKTTLRQAAIELKQTLAENTKYLRSVSVVANDDINTKISLNKIRAMYDTDIAIILSYQQDQRSRQSGPAGVLDATVVGAFVAPTVGTTTSTVVDAKIIHIPNNAIIFHASGDDRRSTNATSFGNAGAVAEASTDSLMAQRTIWENR